MTPEQRASLIARHLDELALTFLLEGRRGTAYSVLSMACEFLGEEKYEADSPMEAARLLTVGEGGGDE